MTTANKITIARILLVPLFVALLLYHVRGGNETHRILAATVFGVCALTDALDGFVARRFNQRSELGALLDPMADKLLLVSAVVFLSFDHRPYFDQLPLWLAATIIGRDLLMFLGWVVIHQVCGRVRIQPRLIGKLATVLQMITVFAVLMRWHPAVLDPVIACTGVTTGVAGLLYVWDGFHQLSTSPTSGPHSPHQSPERKPDH